MKEMELNHRKLTILSSIAKEYLKTGEPVGSKALVSALDGAVSSATIRNDMSDLERMGLLYQPHTSAGRLPTASGLRLYIDQLMEKRRLSKERRRLIDAIFQHVYSVEGAIDAAAEALAEYSGCASFSTAPTGRQITLQRAELLRAGPSTLVLVLLTDTGMVKSAFVQLDAPLPEGAFEALQGLFLKEFAERALQDITPPVLQTAAAALGEYSLLLSPVFQAFSQLVQSLTEPGLRVSGQDRLFSGAGDQMDAARALRMLHSSDLLELLSPQDSGICLILPGETDALREAALLYTGYHFSDTLYGSIGLLGPLRLDYGSIIPMLEYFGTSLQNRLRENYPD